MIVKVDSLLDDVSGMPEICQGELRDYYRRCLEYTIQGGKMTRGLTVVKTALECGPQELLNDALYFKRALTLGWVVELLQGFFLIADDVMDSSTVRRGNLCWYKLPEVTYVNAINDSLFVESCCYRLLDSEFGYNRELLQNLRDILSIVSRKTVLGQHLDTNTRLPGEAINRARYIPERYEAITTHKTAYYTFYLPVKLGLALSGCHGKDEETIFETCMELGRFFQSQDDFLDAFGKPEEIGKIGTDIEEGKLTWLLCKALERASSEQKDEIFLLLGKNDASCVKRVKDIYLSLGLLECFTEFEEQSAQKIRNLVETAQTPQIRNILSFLLAKIYRRQK